MPSGGTTAPRRLLVPKAPVIVLDGHKLYCLSLDGELGPITPEAAKKLISQQMPIVCHGPHLSRFLKIDRFPAYDVLELFAFIHPGVFVVPTARGIARGLHLLDPATPEDMCLSLRDAIRHLLADMTAPSRQEKSDPAAIAAMMGMGLAETPDPNAGWPWTPVVLSALGRTTMPTKGEVRTALKLWEKLPDWAIHAPAPPAGHFGVTHEEAAARLNIFTHKQGGGAQKEERPQQIAYAEAMSHVFAPRDRPEETHMVLAEAGTGTGKTLGYLAPATVWAEKNGGAVWISTYTRNLQKQVDAELAKLYDDPVTKSRKVVTRKGRENYLCLLNLEDATQSQTLALNEENTVALGLMLRWAAVTEEGDLAGKDFPGWLSSLIGPQRLYSFADRRGECIYSACPHFDRCFIEKSVRKSRRADIVIANHALVMHQAAAAVDNPRDPMPTRYIFDEGHHIFDAADSAFGIHLNGTETADLRRWILGSEIQSRSRARGIKRRLDDLIAGDDEALADVEAVIHLAHGLPGHGWRQRLWDGAAKGPVETFLVLCRQQVMARNPDAASGYSIETSLYPAIPDFFDAAHRLAASLEDLKRPMTALIARLQKRLEDEAEDLDSEMRERIQYMISSLSRRADNDIGGWIGLLKNLSATQEAGCVDWLEIARIDGHDHDVGFYRAYIDPVAVFAKTLKPHVHGIGVTSATLRDISEDDLDGWKSPLVRSGAHVFAPSEEVNSFAVSSPFDYPAQTKIFVIKDVRKEDVGEVAGAMKALFTASGGGALGIFTAVQRLKAVQKKIVEPLEAAGLPLYAQHADPLDIATLIDIFKEEENACLLGTDATRDGIDVPGRSLRLVVYDRVPWPRPTLLHKARRDHFGKSYDDMLTRFKIKQAFGRLIRKHDDKGVFVMLDAAMPSRLAAAFPPGVEIERIGLKDAASAIKSFLSDKG